MKIKKILLNSLFVLVLLISLAMIFNRQIKNYLIHSYQPQITRKMVEKNQKRVPKKADFDFSKTKSLDFQTAMNARAKSNDVRLVGQILLPKSKVHLPIGMGVSNITLSLAAGTMRPDQKMGEGNYPLAGHHMVDHNILFGPLYYKTKVGDNAYLTDMKNVYQYKIYTKKFVAATRVDLVNQTKQDILTLITCDKTGANRLMLRGKLVDKYQVKNASPKLKRAINQPANV